MSYDSMYDFEIVSKDNGEMIWFYAGFRMGMPEDPKEWGSFHVVLVDKEGLTKKQEYFHTYEEARKCFESIKDIW